MYTHDTTDHEQTLLDHWQEATTTDAAPAPALRYRLPSEAADALPATPAQVETLVKLLNAHTVTLAERTKMLLALPHLSVGYATRAIARLHRVVSYRLVALDATSEAHFRPRVVVLDSHTIAA